MALDDWDVAATAFLEAATNSHRKLYSMKFLFEGMEYWTRFAVRKSLLLWNDTRGWTLDEWDAEQWIPFSLSARRPKTERIWIIIFEQRRWLSKRHAPNIPSTCPNIQCNIFIGIECFILDWQTETDRETYLAYARVVCIIGSQIFMIMPLCNVKMLLLRWTELMSIALKNS